MNHDDPVESVWTDVGEAEPEEPKWVVKNIIPTGITFLAGPPKSYKSTVELALALTACDVQNNALPPDLSEAVEPGIVMGLSMEAAAGVLRHNAETGFRIRIPDDSRFLVMSDPWRFRLDQPQDVHDLLGWVTRLRPRMLFIDPLRNCHSLDENDSGGMVMMLQPIQQYAVKNDMAVVIVHHSKKIGEDKGQTRNANAGDMRGTSALFGMADAVLTLTGKGVGLVHIDAILKRGEPWQRTIQLGVWDAKGTESIDAQTKMVFGLIATGLGPEAIAAAMKLRKSDVALAIKQLQRLGALTGAGTPTSNGPTLVETAVRKFVPNT